MSLPRCVLGTTPQLTTATFMSCAGTTCRPALPRRFSRVREGGVEEGEEHGGKGALRACGARATRHAATDGHLRSSSVQDGSMVSMPLTHWAGSWWHLPCYLRSTLSCR